MATHQLDYLHEIRSAELERVLKYFPASIPRPLKILEVGAGTGFQARLLSNLGFDVTAVDIPESAYRNDTVYPVTMYDGFRIPSDDRTFDVVFSSNVLEHVSNLDQFLEEMRRVTALGGLGIHLLPTPAWRIWTTATHYIWLFKTAARFVLVGGRMTRKSASRVADVPRSRVLRDLVPTRHGERGSMFTEAYYFSSGWWQGSFAGTYEIAEITPAGVFYTGNALLGPLLPMQIRRFLAIVLGSSCNIYVVRPRSDSDKMMSGVDEGDGIMKRPQI